MNKLFILGPCAAETREQIVTTAEQLNSLRSTTAEGITTLNFIYRAGIWKPRTSPSTFQGVGETGLSWLQEVSETYKVPVATEVANPEHVKAIYDSFNSQPPAEGRNGTTSLNSIRLADRAHQGRELSTLNYYIWIGARTSANPIAVQTIADALLAQRSYSDSGPSARSAIFQPKAVLIKNPVNEDINLWIGNIERLQATGLPVIAVHRGCNHKPCWAMAFELRRRKPEVKLLLDPSHMSGDAVKVPALCQLAMDLNYDGLMVEVHNDPTHALSDAKQQLTPAQAIEVIKNLKYRDNSQLSTTAVGATSLNSKLSTLNLVELRSEIDEVDDELWKLIAQRVAIARKIGDYKREHKMPVLQAKRYDEILQRRLGWAKKNGVSVDAVQSILEALHNECVSVQL